MSFIKQEDEKLWKSLLVKGQCHVINCLVQYNAQAVIFAGFCESFSHPEFNKTRKYFQHDTCRNRYSFPLQCMFLMISIEQTQHRIVRC